MKTELLAPAKDKEIALCAIDCGADAVYIGASCFGARQNAGNTVDDIREVVEYAHKFRVKVFVTVNTILTDSELEQAVKLIKELDAVGVDAILVQDMGLLKRLIELGLPIPIHASTQCDNRNLDKIKFFNELGLSRVVLARELSLEQIKEIHNQNPDLELEAFIQGALCVSYSGQCYLSQYIGGRSANRGECAQPCRKKYTVLDDKGNVIKKDFYALSLKDFNASKHIKDMIESGVYSFKIEGRLKDKGYVKNIVSYYRQELDKYSEKASSGKSMPAFVPAPGKTFNRGFTDYFLNGRTDCFNQISPKSGGMFIGKVERAEKDYIFVKTGMEISAQDGLCYVNRETLEGFLVNKVKKVENGVLIYPNRKVEINSGTELYRNYDVKFEKELSQPVKRQIGLEVTANREGVNLKDEDGVCLTIKFQSSVQAENQEKMNSTFVKQFSKTGDSDFYVKDIVLEEPIPFMPVSEINRLRRDGFEALIKKRLDTYKREVQKPLKYTTFYKKEVDYRANVHNKEAQRFYELCDTKVNEWSFETKTPDRQVELMRTKHCIKYALNMCKSSKNLILKDEKGVKFSLKFDCKNCEMVVLSP